MPFSPLRGVRGWTLVDSHCWKNNEKTDDLLLYFITTKTAIIVSNIESPPQEFIG